MRKASLRGVKGKRPRSVSGTGKAQDPRFRRLVLLTVTCIDESQDVCFIYLPLFMYPEAFRSTVKVLGRAA